MPIERKADCSGKEWILQAEYHAGIAKKSKVTIQINIKRIAATRHHFCQAIGFWGGKSDWAVLVEAFAEAVGFSG